MFRLKGSAAATAALGFALMVGCVAHRAQAGDHCFYKGRMFSDGAAACQGAMQYRCDDGDWRGTGTSCTDSPIVASRPCTFDGMSFSTGSASCQAGTQFRCEDGTWKTLGTACTLGDSPIRAMPSGRTCMYEGATVASASTICKQGTTFLCSDGAWVNLGTLCR
jgi:hypothetical protein